MGYNPHGHARINPRHPQALGICQRCGFQYQRVQLRDQTEYQGFDLQQTGIWVCPDCWDIPNENLTSIILPPDPMPVYLPFPEPYSSEVETPAASTLSADALAGATSIVVEDASDFSISQQVCVTLDSGAYWVVSISGIASNTLTVTPALAYVASEGQQVNAVNGST